MSFLDHLNSVVLGQHLECVSLHLQNQTLALVVVKQHQITSRVHCLLVERAEDVSTGDACLAAVLQQSLR